MVPVSSTLAAGSTGSPGGSTTLAPWSTSGKWAMFGYNPAGTRYNPNETILNTTNVSGLTKRWSYTTGEFVQSSPVVENGAVYVGSWDDNLYAVNAKTGVLLWSYNTPAVIDGAPAVANGVVYVSSRGSGLYALNATTGALLWSYSDGSNGVGNIEGSPVVTNGVVYVSTLGNAL
jgi:polyvinyl alcohol dehydrogenase (cytochrome)